MHELGRQLRARITYANVAATMALVLALAGGAYAAATLPRNSVGSPQIKSRGVATSDLRTGAVHSRQIHNRSIRVRDLSVGARESLRGQKGEPGPTGPAGVTLRASVTAAGERLVGNAIGVVHDAGSSGYRVRFPQVLSGCVPTATLAAGAGEISASITGDTVIVTTSNSAGAAMPASFNVVVAC
jgi:hypothetical protein